MSLKAFVNNKDMYDAFLAEVDESIAITHRSMEQVDDMATLYRLQGSLMTLRKMKYMRDKVNGQQ
jgi:hypothetical protein